MSAGFTLYDQGTDFNGYGANIYRTRDYQVSEGARALAEWMEAGAREGCSLYYINFMFADLHGPRDAVLHQMRASIRRGFYSPLCRLSAHHPQAAAERHRLAEAILFPDLPAFKANSGALLHGNANGGFHYNGGFRIPPSCRLEGPLEKFVEEKRSFSRRHGIAKIDVRPADRTLERLADYATKTVKRNLVSLDDILVLPLSNSEVRKANLSLTPEEKALKDIASSVNCSPELASEIYFERSSRNDPVSGGRVPNSGQLVSQRRGLLRCSRSSRFPS